MDNHILMFSRYGHFLHAMNKIIISVTVKILNICFIKLFMYNITVVLKIMIVCVIMYFKIFFSVSVLI